MVTGPSFRPGSFHAFESEPPVRLPQTLDSRPRLVLFVEFLNQPIPSTATLVQAFSTGGQFLKLHRCLSDRKRCPVCNPLKGLNRVEIFCRRRAANKARFSFIS